MPSRKKHTKNTHHEYISTDQHKHGYLFRLSNYFVLLSMIGLERFIQLEFHNTEFHFPESVYLLVFSAIVGYDVQGLLNLIRSVVGKKR